jgi:hypothetical protein
MIDQLTNIDEKISRLKKRREKVQTQQAIFFMREVQRIFQTNFSPDVALSILAETWTTATEKQQTEWKKRAGTFHHSSLHDARQKPQATESADKQD